MNRPRVLVTRKIPANGLERLRPHVDFSVWEEAEPMGREKLLESVPGCQGLLSMPTDRIDAELLDAAGPRLRVVSNFAVGYNNIDVAELKRRGVAAGNTPDVLTDATADIAVLLLMAAARRVKEATEQVRQGEWRTWEPTGLLGADLVGRTLGIVGMGRIGAATAQRLVSGWKMRLLYTSRREQPDVDAKLGGRRVPLQELLAESDFVSVHTALTEQTSGMFDRAAFGQMKPGTVFVNTSRGGVVDQTALLEALQTGPIRAAGLDVTTPEPLPADHPLVLHPRCFVLPHIGSATDQSRAAMAEIAADNLLAGIRGEPLRCPIPESADG